MSTPEYVYGAHAVAALLAARPASVSALAVADSAERRCAELLARATEAGITVERVTRQALDRRLPGRNHQGVVATVQGGSCVMEEKALPDFLAALTAPAFLLVLDGVQDPHNLGACLRSADAAGVHAVILPKDRAAGITPVVHKVACGAVQSMPIFTVTNLARSLRVLREAGIWLYGASDSAPQPLYDADLTGPLALVLGGEGSGLRRLTRELCDFELAVPMAGTVSSLNVSVAAGVLLFEAVRQRRGGIKNNI
ncbi:MAG TPA: 23S rRNA (guanosine(2251)-2'-O)-methyltransferase RlmB [Gammaproteobacteria bacterium]|nr:23S rRNA (guanosine(2251)-2'-O)-methyltransferase RlmB [Gammaproteobacteria bacterium]